MNSPDIANAAASVKARLLNLSRERGRPYQELLQYYGMERFLYRLGVSQYCDRFILKGALLLHVWKIQDSRATRDIDMLAQVDNSIESLIGLVREVCNIKVQCSDGIFFKSDSVTAEIMQSQREYAGVRIKFQAKLEKSIVPMQIDLGFDDAVTPEPQKISYPTLLDLPAPNLRGYSVETVISEKLHTMVEKNLLNSRVKDYHDVWMLFRREQFNRQVLKEALTRTFKQRRTLLNIEQMIKIIQQFGGENDRQLLWKQYREKGALETVPRALSVVCDNITEVLGSFCILEPAAARKKEPIVF